MLYLLDANTLIDAKRDFYGIDQVPEFWAWLVHQGTQGLVKIPVEVWEEFADTKNAEGEMDDLAKWAKNENVKAALLFAEDVQQELVAHVTEIGYVANPTDDDLVRIGRDPFLISYALVDTANRCIVTSEVSRPKAQGANRQVPDVCNDLKVRCISGFQFFKALNFRTNWKSR